MTVMGEAAPGVWAEEFERSGRVVFPQRRRRIWVRLGLMLLAGLYGAGTMSDAFGDAGGGGLFAMIYFALYAAVAVFFGWQLVTRRPVLTVDRTGIRYGRRKPGLAWEDVATIGFVSGGPKIMRTLPVIPQSVWANPLNVQQDNVKDLQAFAGWLTEVLARRRSAVQE
ncbi:hypothetical protein GCM10009789_69120 [Kribbella sancticallisti]|uniref:PH domain-containing protein n=1 Tax=Kribbella sancticallisti TaxID=460087 RepID=A0ABN2EHD6_9ACTN